MADGDLTKVIPGDLYTHAGHLETIAEGLRSAQDAGLSVKMDADAYGKLCFLIGFAQSELAGALAGAIATAATSVEHSADQVRVVAREYESTDYLNAARLREYRYDPASG